MTEQFSKESALAHLEKGEVVIFAAGMGHPFFSTDTITALRGAELDVDGLFFAKSIDGVYDDDPATNPNAKKIDCIRAEDIVKNNLKVIDMAAANLCFERSRRRKNRYDCNCVRFCSHRRKRVWHLN